MPGEFDLIDWIRRQPPPARPPGVPEDFVQVPPGDDLAVLHWPARDLLLVGVDQALDGVHFDSAVHDAVAIGRKVMNRNLSDCAAVACLPAAATATVALPAGAGSDYARQLYLGLRDAADPYGCPMIGGDTASWRGKLVVTVTILGRSAGLRPLTRGGARPGDNLFVTGPLGGSILGRHMTFEPRVKLARKLAQDHPISAMIDVSDGLSRDLRHICRESGVGAVVESALVPVHTDAVTLAWQDRKPPLEHALHDGEDHELLFTSPAAEVAGATRIGRITEGLDVLLQDASGALVPLQPLAWEHRL